MEYSYIFQKLKIGYVKLCREAYTKPETELELTTRSARAIGYAKAIQDLLGADAFLEISSCAASQFPEDVETVFGIPAELKTVEHA